MADGAVTGFHHLSLTVRDLDESASWYEGLFDLDPVMDEPGDERRARVYRLRNTGVMLGLTEHRSNDGSPFRPDRTGLDHAAFSVRTRDDVDVWAERLDAAGVEHSGRIDIVIGAILNFVDPDGVQLSIFYEEPDVLAGFDHVAVLTADLRRFVQFYADVFGAEVEGGLSEDGLEMVVLRVGPTSEINVFQIDGNVEAFNQTPIFGRGRLDHFAFRAVSLAQFDEIREELMRRGCSDGFVTDFGHVLSVFFRDPEGLELEVCVANPDAVPGRVNPPGTPAARYHAD